MADDLLSFLNKFLSLLFIFAVTAINLWLIGNFIYWKNVFCEDKKCIITSIALSDLIVGFFCLPVEASLYFDIYMGGPGCILSYVGIYSRFFSPFVYGIGISVLCIELVSKLKRISLYHLNKFFILFISSIPWLLAVIIVIPLIFSGASSESCWYLPGNIYGLCIWSITTLLPIPLFWIAWIVAAFVKWELSSTSYSYSVWTDQRNRDYQQLGYPTSQSLVMNERTEGSEQQAVNIANIETTTVFDNSSNFQPMVMKRSHEAANNPNTCYEAQELVTSPSPTQQDNLKPHTPATDPHQIKDVNNKNQTLYLLLIIIVHVTLTVPLALYNLIRLTSVLYGSDSFTSFRTLTLLEWIQSSRSFVIPLVWSIIFHIERRKVT